MEYEEYTYYNQPALIAALRAEFVKEQRETGVRLQNAIDTDDYKAAHLLVHTLKGNAGVICEVELVKLASEVVPLLKAGERPAKFAMDALQSELSRVLDGIPKSENPPPFSLGDVALPPREKPKPCVLLIDDSPLELRALSMMLSDSCDLLVAKDGQSGIDLAVKNSVNLILLDLNMPGKSGFEVLYDLKNMPETKNVPVIIVTGSESANDEVRGLGLGAADFIRKPLVEAIVNLRVNLHLQLREHIKSVEKLSLIDGLTGISNRRGFEKIIKSEWRRAMRKGEWLGMLILDIDRFKSFNDKYGHLNGDICLKTIANVMVEAISRGHDNVFRWGGEEFMAILPDTSIGGVIAVAERLRVKIEQTPIYIGVDTTFVTASIGVGSIIPAIGQECDKAAQDKFFEQIDKALYQAKSEGRNRVKFI